MSEENNAGRAGRIPPRIIACSCNGKPSKAGEFQDKEYGKGMRIHNGKGGRTTRNQKPILFSCTVCGTIRNS